MNQHRLDAWRLLRPKEKGGWLAAPGRACQDWEKGTQLKASLLEGQRGVKYASHILAHQRAAQGKCYQSRLTWGIDGELAYSGCLVATQNKGELGGLLL